MIMRNVKEKKERALGTKLFLKAERCSSHKCVMIRKPYRPVQHGQKRRRRISEFGRQLQEKQKIQIVYGLTNKQMSNLFRKYSGAPQKLVASLEKRLDRSAFLSGLAPSTRVARQLVTHGHIMVNEKKMTIPSYSIKKNDVIAIKPTSRSLKIFEDVETKLKKYEAPKWLKVDSKKLTGTCVGEPTEKDILPFDINLVGEYYSR